MPLDPQAKTILDFLSQGPSLETLPLEEARASFEKLSDTAQPQVVENVEDRTIPGPNGDIPIRIYNPFHDGSHPAFIFYHGGGWVVGSIETHDPLCRSLANLAQCIVISVDYRLAPEHKFPKAVEDAYAAAEWIAKNGADIHVDTDHIAVGGDSAGGNLATVTTMIAKEKGRPALSYQVLFYPSTGAGIPTESERENGEGYFLTTAMMTWFAGKYFHTFEELQNPYAVPLKAEDLSGLPPALVITAEFDPLRDEGKMYADELEKAGVDVVHTCYDGMIHGFVSMDAFISKGTEAIEQAAGALRDVFRV
ncbi:alpha/beta hydrolase [Salicibibacter halophilus]|uniref:Alpha/beta hydrolase n=1 Tax=Salicibibacter halophilus TaxID=2502791 RepID=A0A514LGC1_9BACI|nr:alpha/beta hydrolase [Salicibibacter halophilus]QDI90893.1 alpha/beta hydrolase [Salicibibacter halophilus]